MKINAAVREKINKTFFENFRIREIESRASVKQPYFSYKPHRPQWRILKNRYPIFTRYGDDKLIFCSSAGDYRRDTDAFFNQSPQSRLPRLFYPQENDSFIFYHAY